MKVRLYSGSLRLVEKSGVGQAVHHQHDMLKSLGVETTSKNDHDTDIVHINTVFPDSVFAAFLSKMRKQKVIYYGHSTMEDFRNSFKASNLLAPLFKQWIKFCYSTGNIIITPTDYSKQLLKSYGIKKPIYALSNGIDANFFSFSQESRNRFRKKYKLNDSDKAVISVGHYIVRKGILDFIDMARSMPEYKFYWFGYTNLNLIPDNVKEAIETAPENIIFPGYVDRNELRDAYCGCDLFCFMSYEETEGIVILEALSCSIPVLVRDIPVYEGWLENGKNVYKSTDQSSFIETAKDILKGTIPDLTASGRATAESRSICEMGKQLLSIYNSALSETKEYSNKPIRFDI